MLGASGLFGETWDDLFRIAAIVLVLTNMAMLGLMIIVARRLSRRYEPLLLDLEQYLRQVRRREERETAFQQAPGRAEP